MDIIIAGFGGQGILFLGKLLAHAAMTQGKELSWLPSYGPEMRGGTANCHVRIADSPVGSPIVIYPDVLIAMNRPSLDKFEGKVKAGGLILVDASLIDRRVQRDDVEAVYVDTTKTAADAGSSALSNMVMLGRFLKETGLFSPDEMKAAIAGAIPASKQSLADTDMKAVLAGYEMSVDKNGNL
jgi:2-oxoglutarate ferredoxin oxidoreductase subunit gamma